MKLKIGKFNDFAKNRGYRSGASLIEDMGCSKGTYGYMKYGGNVSSDLVAELYNRFGDVVFPFIDFGDRKRNKKKGKDELNEQNG